VSRGGDRPARPGTARSLARPVAAGMVANLAVGTLFAWSLVADELAADAGLSSATASAVFATAIGTFAVTLLALDRALRWIQPRRLLLGAAGGAGGGLLLTASWPSPPAVWIGVGLLFGGANGVAYGVAAKLAAGVPQERRGLATGAVVAAYAAGPVLLGVVAGPALSALGWRSCLVIAAGTVGGLLVMAAALAPAAGAERSGPSGARGRYPRPVVLALWLVFAGGSVPGLMLFAHAAPLASARGLHPATTGWAVATLAAGNLVGRLVGGWWSDRTGRLPALAMALAVAALSVGALAVPGPSGQVLAAYAGVGLTYGAVSALVPAATVDRVGTRSFPHAYGRIFTAWGCAGLTVPVASEPLVRAAAESSASLAWACVPLLPAALALAMLAAAGPRRDGVSGGGRRGWTAAVRPGGR
jgi:OFA family oxalate/formate antiporter-like MFS transporter